MDDRQINLLLIDNDASQADIIRNALAEFKDSPMNFNIAESLDKGIETTTQGGINAVIVGYGMFTDKLPMALEKIRTAAPGIPVLTILDQKEEEGVLNSLGELAGDYLIKENINGYVLLKTVRAAMERHVLMLELEQYVSEFMASEERFRNIIANNADAMVVVNMDSVVRFVNFAAEKLFGKQAHEMIGKKFEYPLKVGGTTEFKIERGNSDVAIAEMRIVLTEWEGEKAYIASLRDETDRKRAEEENAKLQKQLIQGEKLMSVGMLASGVAHEINNPLTIILGFTQILLRQTKAEAPNYSQLKDIEAASLRCKKIVSQLLLFAHQESLSFDSININDVVDNSFDLIGFQLESANIRVIKKYCEDILPVFGNLQQIEQVFINLMTNAKDAMPGGGTLEISTKILDASGAEAEYPKRGQFVEAVFIDTGTGIPQENLSKIFDPFFTTKGVGKGTGLGLSVCLGIIEKHRGKIRVESTPGKGTTFRIVLPVQADA